MKDQTVSSIPPEIPVGTHFFRQLYLYAFATRAEVLHHVRTQAVQEESQRLPKILESWAGLQPQIAKLLEQESGLADTSRLAPLPKEYGSRLESIRSDSLFTKTFSAREISFALVNIDRLVAAQRAVNLDYVDRLKERYPESLTLSDLVEICLSPRREMDPIQHLEIGPNNHVFSSPNSDIRFLGAFVKSLTAEDLECAETGGLPASAIVAFVGYGAAPVNVIATEQRVVLNNGFHRIFALRSLGVDTVPVVVQHARNVALEFPERVAGLPKQYLLSHPRPVLMKDFFESSFGITLKVRERVKMVRLSMSINQHEVPS